MNYIILDLEWDTAYCKKKGGFINQIIQIGAAKLDEQFRLIDKFTRTVRSAVSKKVTKRFTELTGITTDDMLAGVSLEAAVADYNEWAGDDTVTLTWSNSDLYAIMSNAQFLLGGNINFNIGNYVGLQSFVQAELRLLGHEITNQISLSHAAELLGISTDMFSFHTALDDSLITAAILKMTYNAERFTPFIKDTKNPEFYKKLTFKNYYLANIKDKRIESKHLRFKCEKCGKRAEQTKKWRYKNHWFCASFKCENCGDEFIGRVMFKVTYNGLRVSKRVIHQTERVEENAAVTL